MHPTPRPAAPRPLVALLLLLLVAGPWHFPFITATNHYYDMQSATDLCAAIDSSRYLGPINARLAARRSADAALPANERYARIQARVAERQNAAR